MRKVKNVGKVGPAEEETAKEFLKYLLHVIQ